MILPKRIQVISRIQCLYILLNLNVNAHQRRLPSVFQRINRPPRMLTIRTDMPQPQLALDVDGQRPHSLLDGGHLPSLQHHLRNGVVAALGNGVVVVVAKRAVLHAAHARRKEAPVRRAQHQQPVAAQLARWHLRGALVWPGPVDEQRRLERDHREVAEGSVAARVDGDGFQPCPEFGSSCERALGGDCGGWEAWPVEVMEGGVVAAVVVAAAEVEFDASFGGFGSALPRWHCESVVRSGVLG